VTTDHCHLLFTSLLHSAALIPCSSDVLDLPASRVSAAMTERKVSWDIDNTDGRREGEEEEKKQSAASAPPSSSYSHQPEHKQHDSSNPASTPSSSSSSSPPADFDHRATGEYGKPDQDFHARKVDGQSCVTLRGRNIHITDRIDGQSVATLHAPGGHITCGEITGQSVVTLHAEGGHITCGGITGQSVVTFNAHGGHITCGDIKGQSVVAARCASLTITRSVDGRSVVTVYGALNVGQKIDGQSVVAYTTTATAGAVGADSIVQKM
jgi:hypothetical protein